MHRTTRPSLLLALALLASGTTARAATFTVTTTADAGAGSLRQAVTDAAALSGADTIVFAPALGGRTITLTSGRLLTADADGVTIDATALPAGLVLQGFAADRVFNNSGTLTLRGLTLTGGNVGACCGGGAIYSSGTMTIDRCTLTGNSSPNGGGAIYNDGTMTIDRSALHGNQAGYGAAIYNNGAAGGSLTIRQSTLAGNTASQLAALYSVHPLTLVHVTIANNGVAAPGVEGALFSADALSLQNSVIGGNAGTTDLTNTGVVTRVGVNILEKAPTGAGTLTGSGTITIAAPQLAPLADNGGPSMTMLPLSGSPLIDAAAGSIETVDQRGFARPRDGNLDNTATNDIGAAEYDPFVVTTIVDSGPGSLRDLIVAAAAHSGADTLTFSPALNGSTIPLWGGTLYTGDTAGLTIDASALPSGLTLSGLTAYRILYNSQLLTLRGLTLSAGYTAGSSPDGLGGAIFNYGGTLTADRCTFSGNYAYSAGGAIYTYTGSATLTNSTFAANVARISGGGVAVDGTTTMTHVTITGNSSVAVSGTGGGVWVFNGRTLFLSSNIIAGNSAGAAASADLWFAGTVNLSGPNIIPIAQASSPGSFTGSGTQLTVDPLLLPLDGNGGPTATCLPQSGSPAIDATPAFVAQDQRGVARPIGPNGDIGAVEVGGCGSPSRPIFDLRLAKGVVAGTETFTFQDPVSAAARTGYRVRRVSAVSTPSIYWPILGEDVVDQDNGTPYVQWTDASGAVSPNGSWFYQVTAENSGCGMEGPY